MHLQLAHATWYTAALASSSLATGPIAAAVMDEWLEELLVFHNVKHLGLYASVRLSGKFSMRSINMFMNPHKDCDPGLPSCQANHPCLGSTICVFHRTIELRKESKVSRP